LSGLIYFLQKKLKSDANFGISIWSCHISLLSSSSLSINNNINIDYVIKNNLMMMMMNACAAS
jgi:hypothetical protein